MTRQSDDLLQQFDAVLRDTEALSARLTDEVFQRQPSEGRWSAAQCLDHLNVTNESYVRKIRRALDAGEKSPAAGDTRLRFFGRLFLRMMEPPARRRLPAPKPFYPAGTHDREELLRRFRAVHADLKSIIADTCENDWLTITMSSPATRLIRFNLAEGLAIIAAHDRRHLWQAAQAAK